MNTMVVENDPRETAVLDAFHDLLPTLARALDVREVFQHLSAVAARIVPHDEANLAVLTEDGTYFRLFASTGDGLPELLCREDRCILRDPSQPHVFESTRRFCSAANQEPERKSSLDSFIERPRGAAGHSLRSIALRCRSNSSNRSCSATSAARLPVHSSRSRARSSWHRAASCFSMK
jgi:hypothetical protein